MANIMDRAYEIACQLYAKDDREILEISNMVADSLLMWNRKVYDNTDPASILKITGCKSVTEMVEKHVILKKQYRETDRFVRMSAYGFLISGNDIFELGFSQEDISLFLANHPKMAEFYGFEIANDE